MRYYDTKTHTETNIPSSTTIEATDERVKDFFSPLPRGKKLWVDEVSGLPYVIDSSIQQPILNNGVVEEGITQAELDLIAANKRLSEVDARLDEIDMESRRPMRAITIGTDVPEDRTKLEALDAEAVSLRAERATLITNGAGQ